MKFHSSFLMPNINLDFEINEEELANAVAKSLRLLRQARSLTLKVVSENTGIPDATILRYEKGENIPSVIQLFKLAYFYGIKIEEMILAGSVDETDEFIEEHFLNT